MSDDLKKALLWASMAGLTFTAAMFAMEANAEESNEVVEEFANLKNKDELQKDIIAALTQELKAKFESCKIPKD